MGKRRKKKAVAKAVSEIQTQQEQQEDETVSSLTKMAGKSSAANPSKQETAEAHHANSASTTDKNETANQDSSQGTGGTKSSTEPKAVQEKTRNDDDDIRLYANYLPQRHDEASEDEPPYQHARVSSYDDPYTYSDDSASLSDAYFFPQSEDDELARPPRYRNNDERALLIDHAQYSGNQAQQHPLAVHYGSVLSREQKQRRGASPLWTDDGAIQEDAESPPVMDGRPASAAMYGSTSGNGGPLLSVMPQQHIPPARRKRLSQMKMRQRSRERAVTQVRGKPQDTSRWNKDTIYAVIFIIHVILIVCLAIAFGFGGGVVAFHKLNVDGSFHWQQPQLSTHTLAPRVRGSASHSSSSTVAVTNNDTFGGAMYSDDLIVSTHKSSSKLGNATKTTTTTTVTYANSPSEEDGLFTFDYQNAVSLVCITGFYACVLSYITFGFMLILARALIQVILVFSVLVALGWGIVGLSLDPYGIISITGFAALLLTLGYTLYNWNRIPFAATNLHTALVAMRCTADITILGVVSLIVAFSWCVVWSIAFLGIVNAFNGVECDKRDACNPHVAARHVPIYILLLLSFYWTNNAIKNVVRVTVASAIGTWWFHPRDIRPICTRVVAQPLLRSLTKSFGSICLGSLIIQLAQAVTLLVGCCCCSVFGNTSDCLAQPPTKVKTKKKMILSKHVMAEEKKMDTMDVMDSAATPRTMEMVSVADDDSVCLGSGPLWCFRSGLLTSIRTYLRSCNRWSFTYIGLYGYSFHEGGDRAMELFETREWLDVVSDNLIQNVLVMASIVIGGSAGIFAVVVEEMDGYYFSTFHMPVLWAFVIGSVLGYALSNILLLGVVGSAVNTVLVCFAAGPFEFDKNHPVLSREMREVWSQQVWEPNA